MCLRVVESDGTDGVWGRHFSMSGRRSNVLVLGMRLVVEIVGLWVDDGLYIVSLR